jgi:cytochrome c oxidase cbb3-type subunit I/II
VHGSRPQPAPDLERAVTTTTPASRETYDDDIVRLFFGATVLWAVVGMLVGVIIALQLAWWPANLDLPWTTFGRLRPLHTNAVIFAFTGNAPVHGIYYSMQRLLKTRMFNDICSRIHFWGWQSSSSPRRITLPLGLTQTQEYAELIWPIDIAITLIWVVFAINFFGTIAPQGQAPLRRDLVLHVDGDHHRRAAHHQQPRAARHASPAATPVYSGMTDALVQWWYGHNAVGFFLTTPILGMMYYFLPKAADRPVFSYRLSIIHFWALVFLYIWAGPHHLLYSGLPDWAQTLGMIFSIMLIAPSWGGMLNGLLTLRGAWDRLRTDPSSSSGGRHQLLRHEHL